MKNRNRLVRLAALALVVFVAPGCRAIHINQLEKRIEGLETRVAVLESQVATMK